LAVIAEIYDGQTSKAYNRLKAAITDEWVRVNEKYEKQYDLRNWAHIFATSNSRRALKLDDSDRRWFIPGIVEGTPRPSEYFRELREWLEDSGLSIIVWWANEYVREHGPVLAGVHAPMSLAKQQTIEEGRSIGERQIAELGARLVEKGKVVVRLDVAREWLANRKAGIDNREFGQSGNLKLETPEKIASILRSCGFKWGRRFKADGKRFRALSNFELDEGAKWEEIECHCCPLPM
jgi:hypothetical protein